jgi:hypothetical protein
MVVVELELDGPVAENECKTWTANMRIPPLSPSMLQSCSIIDLTYKLMVSCNVLTLRHHYQNALCIILSII